MVVVKLPFIKSSSSISAKLCKGMGHNYMGEPAFPNDILYIFPVVIFGLVSLLIGISISQPYGLSEPSDPFGTPLEILPEWYIFATFNLIRVIRVKILGILSMAYIPLLLLLVSLLENVNKYQNPFRRPVMTAVFISSLVYVFWMSFGSVAAINEALPLL